jgi:hypothetical protein
MATEKQYQPSPPSDRRVNPSRTSVVMSAVLYDPNKGQRIKLEVHLSKNASMKPQVVVSSSGVLNGNRATVTIKNLTPGTKYYARLHARDATGRASASYASETFRTDGTAPTVPNPNPVSGEPQQATAVYPPSEATSIQINTQDAEEEMTTRSTGSVSISAQLDDPDEGQRVRLIVQYSSVKDFSSGVRTEQSLLVDQGSRASVTLNGLAQNTLYYCRLYSRDSLNVLSANWSGASFWTNRFPTEPTTSAPPDNVDVSKGSALDFVWNHEDPDEGDTQAAYELRYRVASTPNVDSGAWTYITSATSSETYSAPANTFLANTYYEWQVRTRDMQGGWGPFSFPLSFYVTGVSLAPALVAPVKGQAQDVSDATVFQWTFRDPDQGDTQVRADLRYRVVGAADWLLSVGDTSVPGNSQAWAFPVETFAAGQHYEWQVRTLDSISSVVSDWSESGDFWTVRSPGTGSGVDLSFLPDFTVPRSGLGCGMNEVLIYERGGRRLIGKIEPLAKVDWNRKRDDISNCIVLTNGFGADCCRLLSELRCWMHEVVVFRDGQRVWEGPITRITYKPDEVEIEAKDVMAYLYRRIMRQGYNDSYRLVNGQQLGLSTVVERAERIALNALAPSDPNLLPYLTSLKFPDDTRQSRVVPDMSRMAWEEIDDLAATAGLDYTTVGRRILLWDTHRYIGRLPEMRDEHFSSPPVVTEYGMQLATAYGVTNNNGVFGLAVRDTGPYGPVEQLASAYGETEGGTEEVLTAAGRLALERTLDEQAERNIAGRYPTPLLVRVPDNSTLSPDMNVDINQLVPGVWVPLRARGTCREVTQWQKLDAVGVSQDSSGEKISVTMSPAPNAGQDPDAEAAAEEN